MSWVVTTRFKKYVIIMLLISTIVISLSPLIRANPIPSRRITIKSRDVLIHIRRGGAGNLLVSVRGTYLFENYNLTRITVYYPIPPEALAGNITVLFNNETVKWGVKERGVIGESPEDYRAFRYETIEGVFPLLELNLTDLPNSFMINVEYSYLVGADGNGTYHVLYPMSDSSPSISSFQDLGYTYITIVLEGLQGAPFSVALVSPPSLKSTRQVQFSCALNEPREVFNINVTMGSPLLHLVFARDLLILVEGPPAVGSGVGGMWEVFLRITLTLTIVVALAGVLTVGTLESRKRRLSAHSGI